jgi:hypothetical protein
MNQNHDAPHIERIGYLWSRQKLLVKKRRGEEVLER